MPDDLTNSAVDRQNILNNPYAVTEIEKAVGIQGISFEGRSIVLKEQVAAFLRSMRVRLITISPITVPNCVSTAMRSFSVNA